MRLIFCFYVLSLCLPGFTAAQTDRIALVLGGGGARGAAHIGVLEVLERERIPIDCVVGTSMGALVAGSYASGLSPADMRKKLSSIDWTDIFLDTGDYSQLSYRKKKVSRRYLSGTEMGVTHKGFRVKSGVVAGEKIKLFFNYLVDANLGERKIENLTIPLAIVATDIGTGEKVVFREGSLTQAMRASMSVPGLMSPVDVDGRQLVDGGLVDNVPVEVARNLCQANRVIAVNVGSPLNDSKNIESLLSVTAQMIGILTQQNVARSLASLTADDVYIYPELDKIKATDFALHSQTANIGKQAAEKQLNALKKLSVDEQTYLAWKKHTSYLQKQDAIVDEIVILPMQKIHPNYVVRQIRQQVGQPLNREMLDQDLIRAYGDGFYTNIDYQLIDSEKNILEINAKERNWSSDYIVLGFAIDNEYRLGSSFNFRAAYRNTWMNSYGGELFATIDIGSGPGMELDFYQPLDTRHQFFIEPNYFRKREVINFFIDDERIAEYELDSSFLELALGTNLGYGQAKLGWRQYHAKGEADVSAIPLPSVNENPEGLVFELNLDRRNRLYFPSHGWRADISYFDSQEKYKKLSTDLSGAYKLQQYVLGISASYISSLKGELPIYDAVMLGGFLKMSGYATNQIVGDDAIYGQLRAERIIGHMPLGLNGDLRLGVGVEAAKLKTNYVAATLGDQWLDSGVIYLGGETPFGPLYLGYGFSSQGDYNVYLQLGAL